MKLGSHGPARLEGVTVSPARAHVSVRSRFFWFLAGLGTAFTIAGFLGGRCP